MMFCSFRLSKPGRRGLAKTGQLTKVSAGCGSRRECCRRTRARKEFICYQRGSLAREETKCFSRRLFQLQPLLLLLPLLHHQFMEMQSLQLKPREPSHTSIAVERPFEDFCVRLSASRRRLTISLNSPKPQHPPRLEASCASGKFH